MYSEEAVKLMLHLYQYSNDEDWRPDLQKAFQILDPEQQSLVSAVFVHHTPQSVVARTLGVNQSTVSRQVCEAICQITLFLNQSPAPSLAK